MKLEEFDYPLPRKLIAHSPCDKRDRSRLMIVGDEIEHRYFSDIIDYFEKDDVLVVNEARVMDARLDGHKSTGAPVQLILLQDSAEKASEGWNVWCKIKANRPRAGNRLVFDGFHAEVLEKKDDDFLVRFSNDPFGKGRLPIPWYVKKELVHEERYQTVYSDKRKDKSLAAPTAGLHFTKALLNRLEKKGVKIARVCLHISFDTFLPIRSENILDHDMHEERYEIGEDDARIMNLCEGRLFCVGTTSLRALESSVMGGKVKSGKGKTRLYVHPQYRFKSKVFGLITNFHLPRSSLFVLVCGFAGTKKMHEAYRIAIDKKYRFYSFGDAMLIFRK